MSLHLTEEQISKWIAGERAAGLCDCPRCAAEVAAAERTMALFRESGHAMARHWQHGPRAVERRLARTRAFAAVAALAIVIVAALVFLHSPLQRVRKQEVFVRIPYVVPPAPYERTEIVRMDVPVAALIAAGFQINQAAAAESVAADILLGQDGRALAVSLLSTSDSLTDRRNDR